MTHGSLFSGIGGFDLAAQWMGWKNVFHCDINPFCQKILNHYWPNAKSYTDIKQTDFSIYRGKIDVLSGGFPCQPFSVAGQRKGAEDDRYLWPEMLRVIDEIRPTWVIGENVAGLVSMVQPETYKTHVESQTDFFGETNKEIVSEYQQYVIETVCSDLERIGYSVQPVIIPACAVGAPHRMDRIWFIAYRTDSGTESLRGQEVSFYGSESITNASSKQSSEPKSSKQRKISESKQRKLRGSDRENDSSYSECSRGIQILHDLQGWQSNGEFTHSTYEQNYWTNFPTQSPVCSGYDGLPRNLDGITFPKWRAESIKAYGNAVVPQVVFEIYKTIESLTPTLV